MKNHSVKFQVLSLNAALHITTDTAQTFGKSIYVMKFIK